MPRLTERRQRQTRTEISDAAIALFTAHGYDNVTMDQVAEAAGVSRRTAYRHFPNKYDLVFDYPVRWLEHFEDIIATRSPGESTRELCRRGVLSVAALIQSTADGFLEAWTVFVSHESLRGRNPKSREDWMTTYATLVAQDVGLDPSNQLEILTVAGSLVAMTDALCATWADQQPHANMVELTATALDHIDVLWPDACR